MVEEFVVTIIQSHPPCCIIFHRESQPNLIHSFHVGFADIGFFLRGCRDFFFGVFFIILIVGVIKDLSGFLLGSPETLQGS